MMKFELKNLVRSVSLGLGLLVFSFHFLGCNTFSGIDNPETEREISEKALEEADSGDCVTARDRLSMIFPRSDDTNYNLGFARLCIGGATLETIGATVVTYSSSSGSDYTVVGKLAQALLPWSVSKQDEVNQSLEAFTNINDIQRRAYSMLIARLSRMAMIVAKASGGRTTLTRDDIADSSCALLSCPAGMSDSDALDFKTEVTQLATDASSLNLPGLNSLSTSLNSTFSALAGADAIRFYIRNNVVPAN